MSRGPIASTAITKHCVCGSRRFVPLPTTRQGHLLNPALLPRHRRYRCVLRSDWKRGCPTSSPEDCGYREAEDRRGHCYDTRLRTLVIIYVSANISSGYKCLLSFWISLIKIIYGERLPEREFILFHNIHSTSNLNKILQINKSWL